MNLTRDNLHKFRWDDEQRRAVQQLKDIFTGPDLMLAFPDLALPYVLSTDASQAGLGAILKQIHPDGRMKVIYYLSRMLSNSEKRYSTTELEALAIVWSFSRLHPYILGRDFRIETDHRPLCQFHKKRSRNGRLNRWAMEFLAEYNITEIKYKKGKCHCDADLLSRYLIQQTLTFINEAVRRKQEEGYLFPHIEESYDAEICPQPIAIINVITRLAAQRNIQNSISNHLQQNLPLMNSCESSGRIASSSVTQTDTSAGLITHNLTQSILPSTADIIDIPDFIPSIVSQPTIINRSFNGFSLKKVKEEHPGRQDQ